jgi:SAM-dependent methyltransferase
MSERDILNDNQCFEDNRALWNKRTPIHLNSDFYDVAGFRAGRTSLCGIEQAEIGELAGRSLLHLQCHFGQDTLALARLGAHVTGVDFSDQSIDAARHLAESLDLPATFLCHNVYDLPNELDERFDIVFTSFGVLGWLPDLGRWASVVHHHLKPGGILYLLEFHPFYSQFDDAGAIHYSYFPDEGPKGGERPEDNVSTRTYTDGEAHAPQREHWWNHTLSHVVNSIRDRRLQIELFHEFPYSVYQLGEGMLAIEPGKWVNAELGERIPYYVFDQGPQIGGRVGNRSVRAGLFISGVNNGTGSEPKYFRAVALKAVARCLSHY